MIRGFLHKVVQLLRWFAVYGSLDRTQAELAWVDSQQFIYEHSTRRTLNFASINELRKYSISQIPKNGAILEFGVYKGTSINEFAAHLKAAGDTRRIVGFDSFVGFSEEWSGMNRLFPKDHFDLRGMRPQVESNVDLVDGFIEDTLPAFMNSQSLNEVAFIHIDTDTYTPAKVVLESLKPHLAPGAIVLFDEFCGYRNWRSHEHRALVEVFSPTEYEFLGFASGGVSASVIRAAILIL